MAAKCANKQGKFWDYHNVLFQNSKSLNRAYLITLAKKIGIEANAFQVCLNDTDITRQVEEDVKTAQELSINGTPTLILNGEVIEGAVNFSTIKKKIDAIL